MTEYVSGELGGKIKVIICEWSKRVKEGTQPESYLKSSTIYERLISEGVEVPHHAMSEILVELAKEMRRWLLLRRDSEDPHDLVFYQAYGPEETSVEELIEVCQDRWAIEDCFAEAKGEVGLDHYEVRRWDAWHRYVTLCLLAHAFLVVVRLAARREEGVGKKGISTVA